MAGATGYIDFVSQGIVYGWAFDPASPTASLVEFRLDEAILGSAVADEFRHDLVQANIGHGSYGFRFQIPLSLRVDRKAVLTARFQHSKKPLERSGLPLAQLVTDSAIVFEDGTPHWELIARQEPLWGILSTDKFLNKNLTPAAREEFFLSGVLQVAEWLERAEDLLGSVRRGIGIDFGCGVGRLTMALARQFDQVIGIDVSQTMLALARENCARCGITNASFVSSSDEIAAQVPQGADFLLSFIVFQHIPEQIGRQIFRTLVGALAPGGVGCAHFVFNNLCGGADDRSLFVHDVPTGDGGAVAMQMNCYDMGALMRILYDGGVSKFNAAFERHGRHLGCILYFRKG